MFENGAQGPARLHIVHLLGQLGGEVKEKKSLKCLFVFIKMKIKVIME